MVKFGLLFVLDNNIWRVDFSPYSFLAPIKSTSIFNKKRNYGIFSPKISLFFMLGGFQYGK